MDNTLVALKAELEDYGKQNDSAGSVRDRRMLNITRDTGEFLSVLVRATAARSILEVGTSNGYSTLWLAESAKAIDGRVTTIELSEYKAELASTNFHRSGLAGFIDLVRNDAGRVLPLLERDAFNLIFLDSDRSQYCVWWPSLRAILRPGGLVIADNAISHADEMRSFIGEVTADSQFTTSVVPVGKGEFLAVKAAA
jgi:predicted O-methyltransferase YrrM